jgi:hypothetical protein
MKRRRDYAIRALGWLLLLAGPSWCPTTPARSSMATVSDLAQALANMEGWNVSGSLAQVNNNPGNLRPAGQAGVVGTNKGYAVFSTPEAGWSALQRQIALNAARGDTLQSFIYSYAPPSENQTSSYLSYLVSKLGISPSTPLTALQASPAPAATATPDVPYYDASVLPSYFDTLDSSPGDVQGDAGSVVPTGFSLDPTTLLILGGAAVLAFFLSRS